MSIRVCLSAPSCLSTAAHPCRHNRVRSNVGSSASRRCACASERRGRVRVRCRAAASPPPRREYRRHVPPATSASPIAAPVRYGTGSRFTFARDLKSSSVRCETPPTPDSATRSCRASLSPRRSGRPPIHRTPGVHEQHHRGVDKMRDRYEILERIVRAVRIERRRDRDLPVAGEEQRVTIRSGLGDDLAGNQAAGAAAVVDAPSARRSTPRISARPRAPADRGRRPPDRARAYESASSGKTVWQVQLRTSGPLPAQVLPE